jgi:membrane-bound lytic murein transglycosylase B
MRRGSTVAGGVAARRLCLLAVLAPLSVAATVGLVRPDGSPFQPAGLAAPAAAADAIAVPQLPDGVQAPASVTQEHDESTTGLGVAIDVRALATDAIPARALSAYQRAESVMLQADASCHLSWQLVAAIGKVESNHGRFGGALMTDDGVVHPAILGPRLTGSAGTSRIPDTDAGLLDGDKRLDRAVGPMQFIPSTWSVVGVDADGDGRRDPQDIDDAALAAAVYLCGGSDDLSSLQGQRRSVHRYNHSSAYVDLVLRIMAGYLHAGPGYTGIIGVLAGPGYTGFELPPNDTGTAHLDAEPVPGQPIPTFDVLPSGGPTATPSATATATATATQTATATTQPSPTAVATPTAAPTSEPTPVPASDPTPTDPATTATPTETATVTPTEAPTETPTGTATADPTVTPTDLPTDPPTDPAPSDTPPELLTAWENCLTAGVDPTDLIAMTACLIDETGLPADDPDLVLLLLNPPVTPPTPSPTTVGRTVSRPASRRRRPGRSRGTRQQD